MVVSWATIAKVSKHMAAARLIFQSPDVLVKRKEIFPTTYPLIEVWLRYDLITQLDELLALEEGPVARSTLRDYLLHGPVGVLSR